MRIFLDSNVLVSAIATRGLSYDVLRLVLARHELVLGETVLAEVERVLRDKLEVPAGTVSAFVRLLRREAFVPPQAPPVEVSLRDPDDERVLAEAVAGEANVLVSGDADLLEVTGELPVRVLTPRALWELLRELEE